MSSTSILRTGPLLLVLLLLSSPLPLQGQAVGDEQATVTLRPGDVVRVVIWREPDLSGEFQVNENGLVILPLLGELTVTGVPFATMREGLMEEYRTHLRNPSITITPLRRVNVLGEVNRPGLYEVDPTISLAGVVAMAGGANPSGDLNRIRVMRAGVVMHERLSSSSSLHTSDIRSGDHVIVERRGWFDRNSTFVVSALLSVTSLIISLTR